jgi:hypothetical protein
MPVRYLFRAECPFCHTVDDHVLVDRLEPLPVVHCGACLMDRIEVVRMTCTLEVVQVS